ncbi:MAG TPA: type I 3-dehydroquinate dehydratase [Pyrinomonadaceae bacterium]|nr:type I 3-dehydroquinate dehydratase [Pyrinomonadaceae bacterium]
MTKVSLIASLIVAPSATGAELAALPNSVDWLEVRADVLGDIDPDWLRRHFKGRLLYSLRSQDEGGQFSGSLTQRRQWLKTAARRYDRVELEQKDLVPELLDLVPIDKRLISWHGRAKDLSDASARFEQLAAVPASGYKLLTEADRVGDEFIPLLLLQSLKRKDTIAYSNGPSGFWSRVVGLQLGAPAIYGLVSPDSQLTTEPAIARLIDDFGLPDLRPVKEIFAIIGHPIFHSLSPRLHNAAYRAMKHPGLFLPLRVESFEEFWQEFVLAKTLESLGMPLNGMTVASPHKETALPIAKFVSQMAQHAESANILVRNNGWWMADTTDPEAIHMVGRDRLVQLKTKRAAVIGCGGAGRAIAAALVQSGAHVTLINRSAERGQHAAEILGLRYFPLPNFDAKGFDIVVNATPVGRDSDEVPFRIDRLDDDAIVIDLVYGSRPTPLVGKVIERRQIAIDGCDVLVAQVRQQFQMMTGKQMSADLALEMLGRQPRSSDN